jgi:ubiquinone biosynthesis protein COQ9
MSTPHEPPTAARGLADEILDTALKIGERDGWSAVRLHGIASEMGIALEDVHRHFEQKDALAEAWFDRADRAMVRASDIPGWSSLSERQRLFRAIWTWLEALAPHRRVTLSMLQYKFQPEHLHLQALGITRVSRTVQLIREAAALRTVGLRRELEEAALTSLYLATFAVWLNDGTPGSERSRELLDRLLGAAEATSLGLDRFFGPAPAA